MELAGSSALVTGGASGLGGATAAALAGAGVAVVGLDLAAAWERAAAPPAGVTAVSGDVTAPDDVQAALDAAGGLGPLRIAVNCAGVGTAGRILSRSGVHDLALFDRVVRVNLVGTFNVLRLAAAAMSHTEPVDTAGQRGLIVNTASVAAFDGQIGQAAYAASKGGVVGLTLPAARDLAQFGIRVVAIASTSRAYSSGRPSRDGCGTPAASATRNSSVMPASMGVSMMPGAIATTRIPNWARSRAAGRVSPTTPPFDAA